MIHAGTTDSIAAFLAAADPVPGAAVTSLGTTLAVKLMSDTRIKAPEMGLYAHRLGKGRLIGGASNVGAASCALFGDADLAALSSRIDPGAQTGLDYSPLSAPMNDFPLLTRTCRRA